MDKPQQSTKIKIGALWEKQSRDGKTYFSGTFGDAKLIVFRNNYKQTDKHPDFILYVEAREPKDNQTTASETAFDGPSFNNNEDIPF